MTAEYLILIGALLTTAGTIATAVMTQRNAVTKLSFDSNSAALKLLQEQVDCLQAENKEMRREMQALRDENSSLRLENAQLKREVDKLMARSKPPRWTR